MANAHSKGQKAGLGWDGGGFVALPPSHTLSHLLTDPMRLFVPLLILDAKKCP